jgi:S1-C subfamily serine protease
VGIEKGKVLMGSRARKGLTFVGGAIATLLIVGVLAAACSGSSGGGPTGDASPAVSPAATTTAEDGGDTSGLATLASAECLPAADIYESVRPSVVEINVTTVSEGFFGQQQESRGAGAGIVLDEDGHILTNNHVAGNADTIEVRFDDGSVVAADLIGTDPANDLAIVKVDPLDHELEPATLGDSSELRVGDWVLAIGSPFNLEGTLTQGIVSGLDRTYTATGSTRPIRDMIQTDAAINPGNSGGPLLNCLGEVVGVNTLLENPTGEGVNVGVAFAVSIDTAKSELDTLTAGETAQHSWLGIAGQDVTPALADDLDLGVESGVYVTLVTEGGPADNAGLRGAFPSEEAAQGSESTPAGGDVIVSVDGEDVAGIDELATYLAQDTSPGDTVELEVVRNGEEMTVVATLGNWPNS